MEANARRAGVPILRGGVLAHGMRGNRVLRDGSWNNNSQNTRSANRNRNTPDNRNNTHCFRVVISASAVSTPADRRVAQSELPVGRSQNRPIQGSAGRAVVQSTSHPASVHTSELAKGHRTTTALPSFKVGWVESSRPTIAATTCGGPRRLDRTLQSPQLQTGRSRGSSMPWH